MDPVRSGADGVVSLSRRGLAAGVVAAAVSSILGSCARAGRPGGTGESREQAAEQLQSAELLLVICGGQVDTPLRQEVTLDFNARYTDKKISVRVDEHPSSGFDQKMATRGAWNLFAMDSQARNPHVAWEFMKYAPGVEGQSRLIRLGYLMSVRTSVNEKIYAHPRTPQHEERWLQATAYQHFEPLCEVYPQMQQVYNYYRDQMMSEELKREPAEVVKLMDETINQLFQTGELPTNWQREATAWTFP